MKKKIALLMACVMAFGVAVGGTLAWLTDETTPVINTFTDSDINITLTETGATQSGDQLVNRFQMVPGHTIDKNPKVTVEDGSEDCWLFVKVTESATPDLDAYITYAIASGWDVVVGDKDTDDEFVLGRKVYKTDATKEFGVIGYMDGSTFVADKVLVNGSVTKAMMDAIDGIGADGNADSSEKYPTLTFTAYASQLKTGKDAPNDEFSAAEAWHNISDPTDSIGYPAP